MIISSPNLWKVLGILTDTADIDACVIECVRVSVRSTTLWIVFGIARSGKALLRAKYIIFISHQWFQVTPLYLFVFIYIFYMLAIVSSY